MAVRKVVSSRGPGGCAKPRRGPCRQRCLSPWAPAAARCSPRGRQACGGALAHAMGRSASNRASKRAGPRRVAPPHVPWRRGRVNPAALRPSVRVASRGGCASSKRSTTPAKRLVPSWGCGVGPRGSTSRCLWSALWPPQRTRVAGTKRASASSPFFLTRKVAGALFINHLGPMSSVCHA